METSSWSCGFHILFQIWSAWTEETSFVSWLIFFFIYHAELNEITLQQSEPLKPQWAFPVNSFCHKYKFISMCHSWHLRILKQYGALLLAFLFFLLVFLQPPHPTLFSFHWSTNAASDMLTSDQWPVPCVGAHGWFARICLKYFPLTLSSKITDQAGPSTSHSKLPFHNCVPSMLHVVRL